MTTYDEVRRRATQIAQVTRSRFMPPWKVEPGVGHFVGQRPLDDKAIALIEQWAKNGAPEGDPNELPPLPKYADGWLLGKPDLIVKPDAAFSLPAQQTDAFRIFAIRIPVTKRTYVTGIEFHPGNARVVHHANIRIDRTPATRRLDEADPLPGYDGLMPRSAEYPGRPLPRLDAGSDRAARAAGAGVDARARQRPGGAAAYAADRARSKTCCRRSVSTSAIARRSARRRSCGSARRASTFRRANRAT